MIRKQDIKQGGNDIAADHEITIAMHGASHAGLPAATLCCAAGAEEKSEDSSGQVKQEGHRADALA
ncbi:hypothetical protein AALC25_21200, partial [Lachnospiraceae bacterium 29-84]